LPTPVNIEPAAIPTIPENSQPVHPLVAVPQSQITVPSVPQNNETLDEPSLVQSANHHGEMTANQAPRPLPDWENSIPASGRQEQVGGVVASIDLANQTAVITLPKQAVAVMPSRTLVVHKYTLGRLQAIGEFEVASTAPGTAIIRPAAGTSIRLIAVGDNARVVIDAPADH
jgi:hypothetical protein